MNEPNNPERKIIIDEDWKSQVEQERAQLKSGDRDTDAAGAEPPTEAAGDHQLPLASFDLLITTLATQALACMGQIPDPIEHKAIVRLDLARHHVDMLSILRDKTQGNLTEAEAAALDGVLHQLRMIYMAVAEETKGSE